MPVQHSTAAAQQPTEHHPDDCHAVHTYTAQTIDEQLDRCASYCKALNVTLTPLRRQVLRHILLSKKAIGAYDLLALMAQAHTPADNTPQNKRIAPPTVYRSLDFLLQHHLIHRLASINAYIPCCHPRQGHDAVFLICQRCHHVSESSMRTVFNQINHLTQAAQFTPAASTLEVSGLCQHCAAAASLS